MPRIHTSKASKDYPDHGILKGDTYYHWAFFRGPKQMSKKPPLPSQTTASPNLSAAYAVTEAMRDAIAAATDPEEVGNALSEAAEAMRSVIDDYDEQIGNLEQAFQGGCPALEEAQERRDACETFADACESAEQEIQSFTWTDFADEDEKDPDADSGEPDSFEKLGPLGQGAALDAVRELAGDVNLEC